MLEQAKAEKIAEYALSHANYFRLGICDAFEDLYPLLIRNPTVRDQLLDAAFIVMYRRNRGANDIIDDE